MPRNTLANLSFQLHAGNSAVLFVFSRLESMGQHSGTYGAASDQSKRQANADSKPTATGECYNQRQMGTSPC